VRPFTRKAVALTQDIKAALKASLALVTNDHPEQKENVTDLGMERLKRKSVPCSEVTPIQALSLAMEEAKGNPNIKRCYITMIEDIEGGTATINLRANLSRQEEVAFRSLGAYEAMDVWRG